MSVAEFPTPDTEFERTPPHDVAAEQCVLGGMLLSKDAIADVIEALRPQDFYRPAHQVVYDAVLDLYGRGEPADAVTVAAELTRTGELNRVGGAPYLHTLISSVPTAANAGYYAKIVRERAVLRRLVEAGTRIVQFGYASDGSEVDTLVDRAQAEVYNVTDQRTSEDYLPLAEIMPGALDEIEAISSRGGALVGVPTGFTDLDALMNGLHPGQMVIVAARPAVGKALALDTPLPTPDGWTTMGDVTVGNQLMAADGTATTVAAATGVMEGRPCYEITFDDGTTVVADADHQWLTETRASRKSAWAAATGYNRTPDQRTFASVKTTSEIAATLRCNAADACLDHSVRNARALAFPERDLPIPPYALGAWLGSGHSAAARITTGDQEVLTNIEHTGLVGKPESAGTYRLVSPCVRDDDSVRETLRSLGVLGNKHIPASYLRASAAQRRALLAGLLDTDGTVTQAGTVQLSVTSERMAEDFRELVVSLGYRCTTSTRRIDGRFGASSAAHAVTFATDDDVFALQRKRAAHQQRASATHPRVGSRFMTSVRRVASVPVRCVEVDHPEHLYLATPSMVPTHNSTLGLDFARAAAVHHNLPTVIFSLEMSRNEITMRLLSAEAKVPLHHMRSGHMNDDDWTRLARRMSEVAEAPMFIDDSPNMTMMEIRAKCRRLKQRHDLRLVIVDYLQLMSAQRRVESRQQEVSELSRSLKLLAKELDVPVIAISQLNRGPEQRTDKKPQLADLRESGCLTASTKVLRADTGAEVSLGELMGSGERDVPVWSLDERLRLVPRTMSHAFPSGSKEVFRLRLASGREVHATGNHPFLTYDGWCPLTQLRPGGRIAVPRHVPEPLQRHEWADDEVVLLAHLIGDQKFVPTEVFSLPRHQVALFLRHLWATDGAIHWDDTAGQARIYYGSTIRRLVDDVSQLLLRCGVMARCEEIREDDHRPGFHLLLDGAENQLRFLTEIGVHGRDARVQQVVEELGKVEGNTDRDTVPREIVVRVGEVRRERLARVADVLHDADLEMMATNDVFWDEVLSIDSEGERCVYDATVLGTHNFIADGIAVHNSIEQDSDVVLLLYREDMFERESPRAGEADLIVAKHRNGPTATVTVAFQGHYSRFVDMAPGL